MKTPQLLNYERDRWIGGDGNLSEIPSAIDGAPVALTGSGGLDFGAAISKEHWTRVKALSRRLATGMAEEYDRLCGALVDVDEQTGRATAIRRVCLTQAEAEQPA